MRTVATPTFDTVVEAISWLGELGFSHDFGRDITRTDALIAENNDFTLDYIIRFEGQTDPADEHILYAMRSDAHGLKGIVLSAFGVYADTPSLDMVSRMLGSNENN